MLVPQTPDLRLSFALNCGSVSCPAAIPIYDPDALEEQLNLVTRWVLDSTVRVEERQRTVVLPKVGQGKGLLFVVFWLFVVCRVCRAPLSARVRQQYIYSVRTLSPPKAHTHSHTHPPMHISLKTNFQVCQWYARDFGSQLFPLLLQCLSKPKADALRRMLLAAAPSSGVAVEDAKREKGAGAAAAGGGGGRGRSRPWAGSLSLSGAVREGMGSGGGKGEEEAVAGMAVAGAGAAQVAIKYAPFAFETRPLRRLDEEEEAMLMQM
jgi:hypothetical protein